MKYKKVLEVRNPAPTRAHLDATAACATDAVVSERALDGSTRGRWIVKVEFTPEADLEIERQCTCGPVHALRVHTWFGPCADGKSHLHECPVAKMAMKEAKWPSGKLK